jgi:predicted nucleotidyltransferase
MATLLDSLFTKKGKILEFFLKNPSKTIHIRHLARELSISSTWVAKAINELESKGIVRIIKSKERMEIDSKANETHYVFLAVKQAYNLLKIRESGLVNYLEKTYNHPESIVVFGSFAKGEDREHSDIDIAVITSKSLSLRLEKFEKFLQKKITIHELRKKKVTKEFLNSLANGIVLSGFLDVCS